MGTTYSNCQVRSDSQEAVVKALAQILEEPIYVGPAVNGWVGVYPEGAKATHVLSEELSRRLSVPVFDWSVYDSDVFCYSLYKNGKLQDEFNSSPHYFESMRAEGDEEDEAETIDTTRIQGDPQALLSYCIAGTTLAHIQEVLHPAEQSEVGVDTTLPSGFTGVKLQIMAEALGTTADALTQGIARKMHAKYIFADHQATDLANLLGMKEELAQIRYSDIAAGDLEDYEQEDFLVIGNENLSQEYKDSKLWQLECLQNPENLSQWLRQGANPNTRNLSGLPLLLHFVFSPKHVEILLAAGADVNILSTRSPYLDPQYPEIFGQYEGGVTALMIAAQLTDGQSGRVEKVVHALLEAGADVNARSETGRTALTEALKKMDPIQHQGRLGRQSAPSILAQNAAASAQVVEMLRAAGATE